MRHMLPRSWSAVCRGITNTASEDHLWQHAVDRGNAYETAAQCHEAQEKKIVVVGGRLAQVELGLLRQLRGDGVVEKE